MTQYLQKVQRGVLVLPLQRKVPSNRWLEETLSVCDVVLVDDGLPGDLGIQLDTLVRPGVHLERHALPLGHGRAVKTGLQHIIGSYPKDTPAVIALADVFSPVEDIALLLMALEEQGNCMAVGIPPEKAGQSLKDRGLKWIATSLFAIVQGKRPTIIRVPLRALPGRMLPAAAVLQGEGDDYILNLLLVLCRKDIPVREIAVLDAVELPPIPWDIWAKLLLTVAAFLFSSLFSAMIDYLVFGIVYTTVLPATHIVPRNMELLTAQIAGRVVSCTINFLLNKKLVFRPESNSRGAAAKMLVKYFFLVIFSLAGSSLLLYPFSHFMGVPAMLAKPVVELVMYFINFFIQRDIIFKTKTKKKSGQ